MPRRVLEGKVISNKCSKTVTVLVERKVREPLYGKIIRRSEKYAAHDEDSAYKVGDAVTIEECRPMSRTKKWKVIHGKSTGESQAMTVDDAGQQRKSVKRNTSEKVEAKAGTEAKPARKSAAKKER